MPRRGEKISRAILLLLDQGAEALSKKSLALYINKFSREILGQERPFTRPQIKRALIHLYKTGLTSEEKEKIVLTDKGRRRAGSFRIDTLLTRRKKSWDGRWRMIIFDIPEKNRKGRDAIRHKLKELKFFKLQDSVWIYPYECHSAVRYLADHYSASSHVHFGIVDSFDQEEAARKFYGIKESALPYEEKDSFSLDFHRIEKF